MKKLYFLIALILPTYLVFAQQIPKDNVFIKVNPWGHMDIIRGALISADKNTIVTGGFDKTIKIWDIATGSILKEISGQIGAGQKGKFFAISLSPDNKYIAAAGFFGVEGGMMTPGTGDIKMYDFKTGRLLFTLRGHNNSIFELAFSSDSKYLLSGSADNDVVLWDLGKREIKKRFSDHSNQVYGADIRYPLVVSAGLDGTVVLRNLITGVKKVFHKDGLQAYRIKISPDGKQIACGWYNKTITIFDSNLKLVQTINNETQPMALDFSPNGQRLVAGTSEQPNNCNVYEKTNNHWNYLTAYQGHKAPVFAAKFIDNNEVCTAGGVNQEIDIWKITGKNTLLKKRIKGVGQQALAAYLSGGDLYYTRKFTDNQGKSLLTDRFRLNSRLSELNVNDSAIKRFNKSAELRGVVHENVDFSIEARDGEGFQGQATNVDLQLRFHQRLFAEIPNTIYTHYCYTLTNDNKILSGGNNGKLLCYNLKGEVIADLIGHSGLVNSVSISSDGHRGVSTSEDQTIKIWNLDDIQSNADTVIQYMDPAYIPDVDKDALKRYYPDIDQSSYGWVEKAYRRLANDSVPVFGLLPFVKTKLKFLDVKKLDTAFSRRIKEVLPNIDLTVQKSVEFLYYYWRNQGAPEIANQLLDPPKIYPAASVFISTDNEWLIWQDNGYYSCSKKGSRYVGYHVNMGENLNAEFYPFEQFDLLLNRPDLINQNLRIGDANTNQVLFNMYIKRLVVMNTDTTRLSFNLHPPIISILNRDEIAAVVDTNLVTLKINAKDSINRLTRINAWVNDVPLFGPTGKNIELLGLRNINLDIPVPLARGQNKIQISALDENGIESYKETLRVLSKHTLPESNLYVVGIAVSDYQTIKKLSGVVDDVRDFTRSYKDRRPGLFHAVFVDTIFNAKATKDQLEGIGKFLKKTKTNDVVIVYYSGHGDYDKNNDYYLYTHDIDPKNISERGIKYENLQHLLDTIPARNKLMLINACKSGEVDKDQQLFEQMNTIFSDLRRGNGAMIISSSSGNQASFTGLPRFKGHSAFGEALLEIMASKKGITINQLADPLNSLVSDFTHEQQQPTLRAVNLEQNFSIW